MDLLEIREIVLETVDIVAARYNAEAFDFTPAGGGASGRVRVMNDKWTAPVGVVIQALDYDGDVTTEAVITAGTCESVAAIVVALVRDEAVQ